MAVSFPGCRCVGEDLKGLVLVFSSQRISRSGRVMLREGLEFRPQRDSSGQRVAHLAQELQAVARGPLAEETG